jgi:flagellar protein FliO/FliZ
MDFLFGEGQNGLRFLFAFVVVLGLIGLTAWLVRRFGSERLGAGSTRGRQPRLAVIDAASVDGRRRLVLIRRDNVEHLLMIGGPTDLVIEPSIVRAAAPREVAPPRPAADPDALPRAVPLGEGSMWPLQPEPAPVPPPAPRPQRPPPMVEEPAQRYAEPPPRYTEPAQRHVEPAQRYAEAEPPSPSRQARSVDPLAGLAAELARAPASQPAAPRVSREREAAREPVAGREPESDSADAPAATADQNLAEMAHRLEAALRRPPKPDAAEPEPSPPRAPIAAEARLPRAEPRPARETRAAGGQKSSLYDNLEREMSSLLGRPNKP